MMTVLSYLHTVGLTLFPPPPPTTTTTATAAAADIQDLKRMLDDFQKSWPAAGSPLQQLNILTPLFIATATLMGAM